jgi:thiopurine S-methyltransferase
MSRSSGMAPAVCNTVTFDCVVKMSHRQSHVVAASDSFVRFVRFLPSYEYHKTKRPSFLERHWPIHFVYIMPSTSSSATTVGLSTAALAVVAAATMSYYYRSSKTVGTESSTSREIAGDAEEDRLSFWGKRWSTGKTGWHKTTVHSSLQKYCDDALLEMIVGGGARILVPLCGKTVDMAFLAQKRPIAEVVGVDGVAQAIETFIQEQPDLSIQAVGESGGYQKHKGESITLLTGDFFNMTPEVAGGLFDGVWDRGSLVAIDPSLREQYVDKIGELMVKPNGRYLLATIVRGNKDTKTGPPFSIDEAEVRRLFGSKSWVDSIQLLDTHSLVSSEPWYKVMYLYYQFGSMNEQVYIISTK